MKSISFCGREFTPEVMAIYEKYKDSGLDVISISMDEDSEKWKSAVKKDQMTWMQGADLKGQDGGIGLDYQVNYVPYLLLLDNERKVIWKCMEGVDLAGLTLKLKELLEN
jgi:hypothetical protein